MTEANPAAGIGLPEAEEHVVAVIHDDDLARLLRASEGASSAERRDTAMLSAGCDLRVEGRDARR